MKDLYLKELYNCTMINSDIGYFNNPNKIWYNMDIIDFFGSNLVKNWKCARKNGANIGITLNSGTIIGVIHCRIKGNNIKEIK